MDSLNLKIKVLDIIDSLSGKRLERIVKYSENVDFYNIKCREVDEQIRFLLSEPYSKRSRSEDVHVIPLVLALKTTFILSATLLELYAKKIHCAFELGEIPQGITLENVCEKIKKSGCVRGFMLGDVCTKLRDRSGALASVTNREAILNDGEIPHKEIACLHYEIMRADGLFSGKDLNKEELLLRYKDCLSSFLVEMDGEYKSLTHYLKEIDELVLEKIKDVVYRKKLSREEVA